MLSCIVILFKGDVHLRTNIFQRIPALDLTRDREQVARAPPPTRKSKPKPANPPTRKPYSTVPVLVHCTGTLVCQATYRYLTTTTGSTLNSDTVLVWYRRYQYGTGTCRYGLSIYICTLGGLEMVLVVRSKKIHPDSNSC